jgi:hypothetical protein
MEDMLNVSKIYYKFYPLPDTILQGMDEEKIDMFIHYDERGDYSSSKMFLLYKDNIKLCTQTNYNNNKIKESLNPFLKDHFYKDYYRLHIDIQI